MAGQLSDAIQSRRSAQSLSTVRAGEACATVRRRRCDKCERTSARIRSATNGVLPSCVICEFGSGVGVLWICDVDVDGRDFWLHGEAAAIRHGWLVFIDGGGEIGAVPLCLVKARPAAHRRHFGLLPTWKGSPPPPSNSLGDGGKVDRCLHHGPSSVNMVAIALKLRPVRLSILERQLRFERQSGQFGDKCANIARGWLARQAFSSCAIKCLFSATSRPALAFGPSTQIGRLAT